MTVNTTLAGLSTTASSNGPDGSVDAPSTLDDAIRYALSFTATLRDTRALLGANTDITSLGALSNIGGGQIGGFRNRILNGDMRLFQRGTSFTGIGSTPTYTADQWLVACNGGTVSVGVGGAPPGGYQSLNVNGAAGVTNVQVHQRIESLNVYDLANGQITVSGYIFQSTGAPMTNALLRVYRANTTDNFSAITQEGSTYVIPSIPNATWTYFKGTFTISASAGTGLAVYIDTGVAVVAGQALAVSLLQCEKGATATTFEQRDIGRELISCQRYYELHVGLGASFNGNVVSSFTYFANYSWQVTKRTAPTILNATSVGNNSFPATVGTFATSVDGAYESRVASATANTSNFSSSFAASAVLT